ncbi:twin transmembrane helix small protein [Thioalkalivibrio thiocyanodenitrificans]|uniref:twin transmembrane helix small protein n=1 Tax=Thioalkalivibrio thiocyanodenitrificans TaxID=243063 RepID=UPI0003781C57|nr:twin transmembrane helix small protein [Thioalkalivibrio thiocyanodenitrificans]
MFAKAFVIVLLIAILGSLGSALFYLMKDTNDERRTVKALTWRIGLSIACFLLLMAGAATGLIQPHGIYG